MILTQKLLKSGDLYALFLSQDAVDAFGWTEGQDIQIHPSKAQPGITLCGPVHLFETAEKPTKPPSDKDASKT